VTLILLPWPDPRLSPNARTHWRAKSPVTKTARTAAWAITKAAGARVEHDGPIALAITFRAPDRRHRDRDNAIGACKAFMDGIADALGVNDRRFEPSYKWGEPVKNGAVEVVI
jgi:crossover junction endodeoxyribonuclease RusA